jgi:glycosyltransferase involved in cell wall biosynthesis
MQPLVSVIIPAFNAERYLSEAIDSILSQTYRQLEVIVVDDGSTDQSGKIALGYAHQTGIVRYCHQRNGGIGSARNRGLEEAHGDFVAFLDADDLWTKDKLILQCRIFDERPDIDVVFGHVREFVSAEMSDAQKSEIRCSVDPMPGHLAATMLIPRNVFDRVGVFDTTHRVGEFAEWYLRALDLQLNMVAIPEIVLWRRIHMSNQGRRYRDGCSDYVRILKTALDRRRGDNGAQVRSGDA